MSYIIKPVDMMTGATAPGIVSFCEKTDAAIDDARSRSNLSKFDRWSFNKDITRVKDKEVRKRRDMGYEED